jgi:hypothetical protein
MEHTRQGFKNIIRRIGNMKEKEFYRNEIIKMVEKIDRADVLEYFYYFIREKLKLNDSKGE